MIWSSTSKRTSRVPPMVHAARFSPPIFQTATSGKLAAKPSSGKAHESNRSQTAKRQATRFRYADQANVVDVDRDRRRRVLADEELESRGNRQLIRASTKDLIE